MTALELLVRLERVRCLGDRAWLARCPAHDDRVQSLSIGVGADERILLCCHAGCTTGDVVASLGLALGDLFIDGHREDRHQPGYVRVPPLRRVAVANQPRIEADPTVTDSDVERWVLRLQQHPRLLARVEAVKGWTPATLLLLAIGYDGRRLTLPVRAPGGRLLGVLRYLPGGEPKMLATRGVGRDLWPAPELHYPPGTPIWLVEGEPDAISATELGLQAVSAPGAGRWSDDWTRRLSDRTVIVVADCDAPGRIAARRAVDQLFQHADVRYVDLDATRCDGHDIGDELAAAVPQGDLGLRRLRRALEEAAGFRQARAA